jgi:hypothetical protein
MSPVQEALLLEEVKDGYTTVVNRSSTSIKSLIVNPLTQTASVLYEGSDVLYQYRNVPVFECFRVIDIADISLGKWVNKVLKAPGVLFSKTSLTK